ncbi:cysteine--tRNA ligase [archaeon]|jgi:cysteinyl-tRNA synthetase|nr:cysteine--tRNA ligase [archaeon]
MLKLYNTLTRTKQIFKPITKGKATIYSCGLTVYNYGHIGNYLTFIHSDILRRYLEFSGYKVTKIVNITDVDDKTIKQSIKENKSLKEFTKKYEEAFLQDEKTLNIEPATKYPKATEHIKEMVNLIQSLLKKEIAYKKQDGIYFNIKKFKDYGKLSKLKLENLKKNIRINNDEYDKENANDFALWKFHTKEDQNVFWETELGKGRPGWHIECSAMSCKYLGQPFDIHTGGIDLIFPHHENEIAQSQAANNKPLANYWMHSEWLTVNGKKMSKSLGNYYTIRDILELNHPPLALRYLFLTSHYRNQLNFTLKNLQNSQNSLERLKNIISEIKQDDKTNKDYLTQFKKTMDDDLNTPQALQILWKLLRDPKAQGKLNTIKEMDKVFALDLLKKESLKIPKEIQELAEERQNARLNKDWEKADKLRDKIKKLGFQISDTDEGFKIEKL